MPEFDFFTDAVRSIPNAEVDPSGPSPCKVSGRPVAGGQSAVPTMSLVVQVDSGDRHPLGSGLVFGRRPEPLADAQRPTTPVAIDDEEGLISRSHLAVFPAPGGAMALDLGSTNGTTLHRDGRSAALPARRPVNVEAGDRLEIGTRLLTIITGDGAPPSTP